MASRVLWKCVTREFFEDPEMPATIHPSNKEDWRWGRGRRERSGAPPCPAATHPRTGARIRRRIAPRVSAPALHRTAIENYPWPEPIRSTDQTAGLAVEPSRQ